jgi:hypothetical protein
VRTSELALIGNSGGAPDTAEQRVAWGAAPAGTARKGPTGGWVERRDPRIRASRAIGNFRSGLGPPDRVIEAAAETHRGSMLAAAVA